MLDAKERTLRRFSEARRPRPLQAVVLALWQRPREGDAGFHREPLIGVYALCALADTIGRVERNINPLGSREERVGVVDNKRERRG